MSNLRRWALVGMMLAGSVLGGCNREQSEAHAAEAAPAEAPLPANALEGIYFRMMFRFFGNSGSFEQEHYFFARDGKFYEGVPAGGPVAFDWAKAAEQKPALTGTYKIDGDSITLTPARKDRKPTKMKFQREKDGNITLDGIFTKRVEQFKKGQTLEGHYSFAAIAGGGTNAVASTGQSFVFKPDGTFTSKNLGAASISARGETINATSGNESSGTYEVSGNTLELRHKDGRVTRHTVYPYDMGEGRVDLNVDGKMFEKAKK